MTDPFNLRRFVEAQDRVLSQVRQELGAGQKRSHWMWFVFPQIRGLGHSATAQRYAIVSLKEARAFLAHPILGPRLAECTELAAKIDGRTVRQIFGSPDDLKFHSSLTLFQLAGAGEPAFRKALDKFFAGALDRQTVEKLGVTAP